MHNVSAKCAKLTRSEAEWRGIGIDDNNRVNILVYPCHTGAQSANVTPDTTVPAYSKWYTMHRGTATTITVSICDSLHLSHSVLIQESKFLIPNEN